MHFDGNFCLPAAEEGRRWERDWRLWEPHGLYSGVHTCVDRAFLFKPNQRFDNPLLRCDCPAEALDPNNDVLPVPSTINFAFAAGVALTLGPLLAVWAAARWIKRRRGWA